MEERKVLDNAIVYIVNDYSKRSEVSKDLEEGNRVVIISSEKDVLSFYGLLLEQYGQYNLYLEDDLSVVDDEYLDVASNRDGSKEEAAIYIGKPLSQIVTETIDKLDLSPQDRRIMTIVKELLKGNVDIKQDATINLLNERLRKERAEKENLITELNELKVGQENSLKSSNFVKTSINLDSFTSNTSVMYIRELGVVPYYNTCIKAYLDWLIKIKNKNVKLLIIDNRLFNMIYNDYTKIESQDQYISTRNTLYSVDKIVSNQIYPLMINDLYKSGLDLLIIIDRILNMQDIVKGKNVHKYLTIGSHDLLEYANNLAKQDFTYIVPPSLKYTNGIIIDKIDKDISTVQSQLYWFSKLENSGDDKRLIFDIFEEKNTNHKKG